MTGSAEIARAGGGAADGPIFDRVDKVLRGTDPYRLFRLGRLAPADYFAFLEERRAALIAGGVPDEDVDYAKRYPADHDVFLADALDALRRQGVIGPARHDPELVLEARRRAWRFGHAGRTTYIYPEEIDLLAALADIGGAREIAFLGAYYGYWAAAVVPALARIGGRATLVDPDPECCALAATNLAEEVAAGLVEIVCTTGEALLTAPGPRYDMVVIDAELPRDHPDPALRGKGVYRPLLEAALPRLAADALIVCHNMLIDDATGAPVFDGILARNRRELAPFLALARTELAGWTEIASTEGVGVGRRRAAVP